MSLAGVASYAYDGAYRRTTKIVSGTTRHFYYSVNWQVLEERTGAGTTPERQFVWGLRYIDDLVFRDRFTSGTFSDRFYAAQDANWNVTAITDASGAIQERYRYSPYGVPTFLNSAFTVRPSGGSYQWETLYTGYHWDVESALFALRLRYLNPSLGTWITTDPLGYSVGMHLANYTSSNPLNYTDPTGGAEESSSASVECPGANDDTCDFTIRLRYEVDPNGCGMGKPGLKDYPMLEFENSSTNDTCKGDFDRPAMGDEEQFLSFTRCDGQNMRLAENNFPPRGFWPPYMEGDDVPADRKPTPRDLAEKYMGGRMKGSPLHVGPTMYFWRSGTKSVSADFTITIFCRCNDMENSDELSFSADTT